MVMIDFVDNDALGKGDDSLENSPSDESEDTMDVGDAIFGLNKQKMWEKYRKADTFDIFCADVERRIHLTLLIPYRQHVEVDSLSHHTEKTDATFNDRIKLLMLYVCQGTWAPPEIILHALLKRERRAWSRIAGIQSLTDLFELIDLLFCTMRCFNEFWHCLSGYEHD